VQVSETGTNDDAFPVLAVSASQRIVLVFQRYVQPAWQVRFCYSDDLGHTWSPSVTISTTSGLNSAHPALAATGNQVYAGWIEEIASGVPAFKYRTSNDGGLSWNTAQAVSGNLAAAEFPTILRSSSSWHLLWSEQTAGEWQPHVLSIPDVSSVIDYSLY
jgi:hypothetical protein